MDNYKIKVKDEVSADEARDLFKELGYHPDNSSYEPYVGWVAVFEDGSGSFYSHNMNLDECVEITIAQLRDLVVLKRGDVKDATHTDGHYKNIAWFRNSSGGYHQFDAKTNKWSGEYPITYVSACNLEEINKDPALISGAEAHQALLAGENVQYSGYGEQYWDTALNCNIGVFLNHEKFPDFKFRIVPRTIKVELELPKPFEPKVGEEYFYLNSGRESGFAKKLHDGKKLDYMTTQFGAWRTEEEIKQVVEQLRKIRGTNS
ncbi:hypothetical protein [Acinetobacter baumannii]|uniref:hypothetical protein n=1 Tax=Acinetobacter baumannii TaxID=470 RepID=UPI000D650A44